MDTVQDPHCMDCRRLWDREFIDSALTQAFRKTELKRHREDVLLDRERSLLPATQPIVENILRGRELRRTAIPPIQSEIDAIKRKITAKYTQISVLDQKILDVIHEADRMENVRNSKHMLTEKRQFVRACPVNDCRGFLSTAWKCGICNIWVCPDCHEVKGEEREAAHTCKPELLETVRMLAADTKPCPKCAALIFKIDGCDQMWCTQCQTAFSWRTGRIETANVHNPHFYQWQRMNGAVVPRAAGDIPCGGLPTYRELTAFLRTLAPALSATRVMFLERSHQRMNDILTRALQQEDYAADNVVLDNSDLRVQYLLREMRMTREDWKRELQLREKKAEKRRAKRRVLEMFTAVGSDLFRRIMLATAAQEVEGVIGELGALREYFNTCMATIGKRFDCVVPSISEEWNATRL